MDDQILDIYVKRTGKTRESLAELMKQEKWLTPTEAKDWGFVDDIIKSKIENKMEEEKKEPMEEEVVNATPEELTAENEALKATIAELEAKLAEYETAQQEMAKAEVEGIVENAIKEGKIKAEAKASIVNFGLADKAGMITMINNIVVAEKKLSTVVDSKPAAPQTDAKADFMANYKANKYVNNVAAYRADFKKAYGYEPKI